MTRRSLSVCVLASAVLCNCASPQAPRAELLGESYRLIERFYVERVQSERVGKASLDALRKLDGDLAIDATGSELVIERNRKPVARFDAPARDDWRAWGEMVARAAKAAAAASPVIAQLPDVALDRALLDGAVTALDRYSHYLSPEVAGQSVLVEDGRPSLATTADGPIRGEATIKRPGKALPSVELKEAGPIAIIKIRRFTASTGKLVRQQLARAFTGENAPPQGLVLDLRDNPGGEIAAAAEVADVFLPRGVVVVLEGRFPRDRRVYRSEFDGTIYETMPLAVIVNGRSASSAEVLAAALQGNRRAVVVGSSTFGKGMAQTIIPLVNGGELWLTSSYMRAPAGYLLNRHGVIPDVCTELAVGARPATNAHVRMALRAQFRKLTSKPRLSLSEAEWAEVRSICPPSAAVAADEIETAKHAVYSRAALLP